MSATDPMLALVRLTGAVEALIGFAQEAIAPQAAKRFEDHYVPRVREALAAVASVPVAQWQIRSKRSASLEWLNCPSKAHYDVAMGSGLYLGRALYEGAP